MKNLDYVMSVSDSPRIFEFILVSRLFSFFKKQVKKLSSQRCLLIYRLCYLYQGCVGLNDAATRNVILYLSVLHILHLSTNEKKKHPQNKKTEDWQVTLKTLSEYTNLTKCCCLSLLLSLDRRKQQNTILKCTKTLIEGWGEEKTFVHLVLPYMAGDAFVETVKCPPAKEGKHKLFHWSYQ